MSKYEEEVTKLSKKLIKSGKIVYTPEHINKKVEELMKKEGHKTKTIAFMMFKGSPEIKHLITLGAVEEVSFDVLSFREGKAPATETQEERSFVYVSIAINRNGKPEIRQKFFESGKDIPIETGKAYKGKINISDNSGFDIPDDSKFVEIEKLHFGAADILKYAEPVEDAKQQMTGIWYGTVSTIPTNEKAPVEVMTIGSLLPTKVWINDPTIKNQLIKGDDIVFGGKYGKGGINANYAMIVKEKIKSSDDSLL